MRTELSRHDSHNICSREWFTRFKSGDTSLGDKPGRSRRSDFEDQALLTSVAEDESLTTPMLADNINGDHSTIDRHLKIVQFLCFIFHNK